VNRIVIVGCAGAGKSTLARALGGATGLPVVHLDAAYWRPGWTRPERAAWRARVEELLAGDRWIIDGNYASTMERRFAEADTIVLLAPSTLVCLFRALRRRVVAEPRPDLAPGCDERIDLEFLRWIARYRREQLPRVLQQIEAHRAGRRVEILRSDAEVRDFVTRARQSFIRSQTLR
jgi:adenylate kinase family enzyme